MQKITWAKTVIDEFGMPSIEKSRFKVAPSRYYAPKANGTKTN